MKYDSEDVGLYFIPAWNSNSAQDRGIKMLYFDFTFWP